MPNPSTSSEIIQFNLTGDVIIDALIAGGERWANSVITYSFPNNGSSWSTNTITGYGPDYDHSQEPWSSSFQPISTSDQGYFVQALHRWENVANIHFEKVLETQSNVGDIRIAYTHINGDDGSQAWTYFEPFPAAWNGDIWIDSESTSAEEEWKPGTYSFSTLIHEIGHAIGLEHPFENPSFPVSLDSISNTLMSYSAIAGNQNSYLTFEPTTPMPLDILAIQYLYGANENYHSDSNEYVFSDTKTYHETIWDSGGGSDAIVYKGSRDSIIDLREGEGSYIGNPVYAVDGYTVAQTLVPNVWIAYNTVIEYVTGGSGDDLLIGNDANNTINGGAGNDELYGGAGNDNLDSGSAYTFTDFSLRQGNDTMYGGIGDDSFFVDSILDTVIELPGEGIDTVWAYVSYSLSDDSFVEDLVLEGDKPINATGNSLSNFLRGNEQDNILTGLAGDDDLIGHRGTDSLFGGAGNDILRAGFGFDRLNGGEGSDIFGFYHWGHFQVDDFNPNQDLLYFYKQLTYADVIGFHSLSELKNGITKIIQSSDRLTVEFGPDLSVDLVGIQLSQLKADMVVFSL